MGNQNQKLIKNYESKNLLEEIQKGVYHLLAERAVFGNEVTTTHSTINIRFDKNLKKCRYMIDTLINSKTSYQDNLFLIIPMFNTSFKTNTMIIKGYLNLCYGPYVFKCLRKYLKLNSNGGYQGIGKDLFKLIYNSIMKTITEYGLEKLKEFNVDKISNLRELENILMAEKLKGIDGLTIITEHTYNL